MVKYQDLDIWNRNRADFPLWVHNIWTWKRAVYKFSSGKAPYIMMLNESVSYEMAPYSNFLYLYDTTLKWFILSSLFLFVEIVPIRPYRHKICMLWIEPSRRKERRKNVNHKVLLRRIGQFSRERHWLSDLCRIARLPIFLFPHPRLGIF